MLFWVSFNTPSKKCFLYLEEHISYTVLNCHFISMGFGLRATCFASAVCLCSFLSLQVSIVGIIRGFAPFVTNVQYSVDDMTGPPLNVRQWLHSEVSSISELRPQL